MVCGLRLLAVAIASAAFAIGNIALAQEGPGGVINPGRDCQTLTTCQFGKGGSYRGCLSSYSCRVCRFVPAKCHIVGKKGGCRELRCGWGA